MYEQAILRKNIYRTSSWARLHVLSQSGVIIGRWESIDTLLDSLELHGCHSILPIITYVAFRS